MMITSQRFMNLNYLMVDSMKGVEIGVIKVHDGKNVLFTERWFMDSFGSNTIVEPSKPLIIEGVDVVLKRSVDLSLKAFYTNELKDIKTYGSEKHYALYLHYDLFNFETKYINAWDGIQKIYTSKGLNYDVVFKEQITDYEKPLRNYQYNNIYETIKELNDKKYLFDKDTSILESLAKKLIKQAKEYNKLKEKAKQQRNDDLIKYGISKNE